MKLFDELKFALAATCFMNAAKERLKINEYEPSFEALMHQYSQEAARKLQLDYHPLCDFVNMYCQVFRFIQEYLRKFGKQYYVFSSAEKDILAMIKTAFPELSAAESLSQVHQLLGAENEIMAKKLLQFTKELVFNAYNKIYIAIRETTGTDDLADPESVKKELKTTVASAILSKNLNFRLDAFLDIWALNLSHCKNKDEIRRSSFSP